jgi:adenylosuccinate lyase
MKKDILHKINALLKDKENIPIEKLEELVQEMLEFFQDISEVLNEGTGEEKKEAVGLMFEIQEKFRELGEAVAKKMGLNSDQIQKMLNPKDFFPEQWKNIENIKKEMEDKD